MRSILVLLLAVLALFACSTEHPRTVDADVAAEAAGPPDTAPPTTEPAVAPAGIVTASLALPAGALGVAAEVVAAAAPAAVLPTPQAPDRMAVCLAGAYALNPEWDPTICDSMQDDVDVANPRKARCRRQRAPLQKFAADVCRTADEETARSGIDLLVPLAVIERESSGGRVQYNRSMKIFQVETDICEWFLSASRIVSREPGTRVGSEVLVWTFGDDQRTNRQAVRVTENEMPRGLRINTCLAGEEGIMQTIPREWKNGTRIEATGEVLRGTAEERRERVAGDPVLQVRLGCQALVEHRDLCPESRRAFWPDWLPAFNLGRCAPELEHWTEYACKVMKAYLQACRTGYVRVGDSALPQMLFEVWPACADVETAYAARCQLG